MFVQLFSFANPAVYFWMLLMFLPNWRVTKFLVSRSVFPIYLAILYAVGIIVIIINTGFGFANDFRSVEGVIHLMSNPNMAIMCWIHMLCFDQAVGHYIYQDNMEHRFIPLPIQSIIFFTTLMFGPFGFLCYMILRTLHKRFKRTGD